MCILEICSRVCVNMLCRLAGCLVACVRACLIHFSTVVSLPPSPSHSSFSARLLSFIDECEFYILYAQKCANDQNYGDHCHHCKLRQKHVFTFQSFHPLLFAQQFRIAFYLLFAPASLTQASFTSYIYNRSLMYSQRKRNKVLRLQHHTYFVHLRE